MKIIKAILCYLIGLIILNILVVRCDKADENGKQNLPILSTTEVIDIGQTTATSGGNITNDGGYSVTERGVVWSDKPDPTTVDNKMEEGEGVGRYVSNIKGLAENTEYFLRAYATNEKGTSYGNSLFFKTLAAVDFVCGNSTLTDIDGNIYNTVLIGDQCWMKENLKTTHYSNGMPIDYPDADNSAWQNNTTGAYAWYDNDVTWKDSYGALYNWYAVNNSNGLCPIGWHGPSDEEWTNLLTYLEEQGFPNNNITNGVGNAMKSCRQVNSPLGYPCNTTVHPRWDSQNNNHGFDWSGFSALPGGRRSGGGGGGEFFALGTSGHWWSATESNGDLAWSRYLTYQIGYAYRNNFHKGVGFSVRCIKN